MFQIMDAEDLLACIEKAKSACIVHLRVCPGFSSHVNEIK